MLVCLMEEPFPMGYTCGEKTQLQAINYCVLGTVHTAPRCYYRIFEGISAGNGCFFHDVFAALLLEMLGLWFRGFSVP